jgi:hypothetical protein
MGWFGSTRSDSLAYIDLVQIIKKQWTYHVRIHLSSARQEVNPGTESLWTDAMLIYDVQNNGS